MKNHTYTFTYINTVGEPHTSTITANGFINAYKAALAEKEFEGCKILKTTFKRQDTAKGPNRAGGLDNKGKQVNASDFHNGNLLDGKSPSQWIQDHTRKAVRAKAYKDFLKYLDKAIENLYLCDMENNGAILSYPIKQLYQEMKNYTPDNCK
jgi:hypothetical protein